MTTLYAVRKEAGRYWHFKDGIFHTRVDSDLAYLTPHYGVAVGVAARATYLHGPGTQIIWYRLAETKRQEFEVTLKEAPR